MAIFFKLLKQVFKLLHNSLDEGAIWAYFWSLSLPLATNMTGLIQWARRESNLELKIRLLMIQILIRHEGKCQVDLENSISKKNKVNYRTSGGLLETPRRSNVFIRSATLYFKYTVRLLNSNIQNRPQKSIAFILNHFLNRIDRSKIKLWSKVTGFIGSEGTSNSDAD